MSYKMRKFHILADAFGGFKPIDAICQFEYLGYQISISTAGISKGSCQHPIEIFTGVEFSDRIVTENPVYTVEDAIKLIDNFQLTSKTP